MEPDMTRTWQSLIVDARFIDLDCCYVYIRGKEMILFAKLGKPDAILSAKKSCTRKIAVLSRATGHCDSI